MRCTATGLPALLLVLAIASFASGLDPHAVLGVSRGAGDAEIRRAYRQLALKLHPDKNPSQKAKERWLRVQQAYEALTDRTGGSVSSSNPFTRRYPQQQQAYHHQQQQRQQQQRGAGSWQGFFRQQQRARQPPPILSDASEQLDAASFRRLVLSPPGGGGGSGGAWLVQLYADASPYCRVLSTHWEAAARGMSTLARFGRVDFAAQQMLVRFLASHLRLFSSMQPFHELPVVIGFPADCFSMDCAEVFTGRITAAGLQQFAATRLLRLARLPPVCPRLLGAWRRLAAPGGRVALLALLPEGGQQPMALMDGVRRAGGRLQAGHVTWRRADREWWADALGVTSAPALVFWRGAHQAPVVVQGSLLTNSIDYAAEIERHIQQPVPPLHAGSAHMLPACQLGTSAAEAAPPGALCVLLLGRGGRRGLGAGRAALEALHRQLANGRRQSSVDLRQAARMLTERRLQLASADAPQQQQLCRHLLRWSGSSASSSSCLCAPWWQRLPAAALGQCSGQQQAVLVAYRQEQQPAGGSSRSQRQRQRLLVAAFAGSLADHQQLAAWLVAAASSQPAQLLLRAPLPAAQLAADSAAVLDVLLLRGVLLASQAELAWRQLAAAAGTALQLVSWRQLLVPALLAGGMAALKWLLDALGGEDSLDADGGASSPLKSRRGGPSTTGNAAAASSSGGGVREMRHSDWEPSPGRYFVLLPLPSAGGGGSSHQQAAAEQVAAAAQEAQQRFACLAAAFQREARLAFRVAPVSDAVTRLFAAGMPQDGEEPAAEQQQQQAADAFVLHPRRGRFQALPLRDAQQAQRRLEEVLDGGGRWRQAG